MCTEFYKKTNSSQEKEKHTLKRPKNASKYPMQRGVCFELFLSAVNVKVIQKTLVQKFLRKN